MYVLESNMFTSITIHMYMYMYTWARVRVGGFTSDNYMYTVYTLSTRVSLSRWSIFNAG